jgi:predicted RNase H-like nuclease (RuvC/YqgF family)
MPTTNTQLQKKVNQQGETISKLLVRLSAMADEVASLQNEVRRFKNNVAEDVKYLTERVDGQ